MEDVCCRQLLPFYYIFLPMHSDRSPRARSLGCCRQALEANRMEWYFKIHHSLDFEVSLTRSRSLWTNPIGNFLQDGIQCLDEHDVDLGVVMSRPAK